MCHMRLELFMFLFTPASVKVEPVDKQVLGNSPERDVIMDIDGSSAANSGCQFLSNSAATEQPAIWPQLNVTAEVVEL